MGNLNKIKLIYYFGEYDAFYKKIIKKNWLDEENMSLFTLEYKKIKEIYNKLDADFDSEKAYVLVERMRHMPNVFNLLYPKKEKFLTGFNEWKTKFENL